MLILPGRMGSFRIRDAIIMLKRFPIIVIRIWFDEICVYHRMCNEISLGITNDLTKYYVIKLNGWLK